VTPRRVLLWRHGRTRWNVEHRFQGQLDPPLDDLGRAQAAAGARLLAAYAPDAVVSSDLRRAVRTARPLVELLGQPVLLDTRLRERSLGVWEGLTRDEVGRRHPAEFAAWLAGREDHQDGSEPRAALAGRALAALDEAPGDTVVLVTHSATAMALTGHLLGLPVAGWRAVGPLANGRWSELTRDEHGWRLRAHNLGPLGTATPPPDRSRSTDSLSTDSLTTDSLSTAALAADLRAPEADALDAGPPAPTPPADRLDPALGSLGAGLDAPGPAGAGR
jgi:glucosyl-3-phosphoglycerate phosphatase